MATQDNLLRSEAPRDGSFLLSLPPPRFRDDAFTDHASVHRTNSAASSGSHHDDRSSSRHEQQSEHTPEHHYGAALGRWAWLMYTRPDPFSVAQSLVHTHVAFKVRVL